MDKKAIVERFLSDGYGLDAAALQFFVDAPEKAEAFLSAQKNIGKEAGRPAIVTLDYVRKSLEQPYPTPCAAKVKAFDTAPEKISVEAAVSGRAKEYEEVKKILSGKLEGLLSVNKIQRQQKFSLIVGVLEKIGDGAAVVEDATGTTALKFDAAELGEIIEGDIVGVECEFTGEQPAVKKIFWPDIPLRRGAANPGKRTLCVFVTARGGRELGFEKFAKWIGENAGKNIHVVAFSGQEHIKDTDDTLGGLPDGVCRTVVPVPSVADIAGLKIVSCEGGDLENYKDAWGTEERIATNLLKRRILPLGGGRKFSGIGSHATFFDDIPDVFVITDSENPAHSNYKGTAIVIVGSFPSVSTFFTVDNLTKDVNKLDLS